MQRQLVDSSNIGSIGYDEPNEILEIEFKSGGVYQYWSVPKQVYESFMGAYSKGQFFRDNIKENYNCREVC
ncbi:MAG: KTSC domain-containing protein [Nanoarchaeota archaeon]|nr:KTSC domain-containing protein [Nanoarchaeota archaeon]